MALTQSNEPRTVLESWNGPAPDRLPAADAKTDWKKGPSAAALKALTRLPQLHAETSEIADLARFLRAAVGAAGALMAMGGLAVSIASGASLQQEFAWSLLVLVGVGAMLRSYIKSIAQAFDRAPLREAAKDLRAVLFYAGFAWGAGAFLLLGANPVPITGLCFAVLPSLAMALLLRDRAAALAFAAPVTLLTVAAIIVQPWSDALVALSMLLLAQGGIAGSLMLTAVPGRARQSVPAGLSLR
jgi:hypothetical protein